MLYGGTIASGRSCKGEDLDIVSTFEVRNAMFSTCMPWLRRWNSQAYGKYIAGSISEEAWKVWAHSCANIKSLCIAVVHGTEFMKLTWVTSQHLPTLSIISGFGRHLYNLTGQVDDVEASILHTQMFQPLSTAVLWRTGWTLCAKPVPVRGHVVECTPPTPWRLQQRLDNDLGPQSFGHLRDVYRFDRPLDCRCPIQALHRQHHPKSCELSSDQIRLVPHASGWQRCPGVRSANA